MMTENEMLSKRMLADEGAAIERQMRAMLKLHNDGGLSYEQFMRYVDVVNARCAALNRAADRMDSGEVEGNA
jgi:hypothetical protein